MQQDFFEETLEKKILRMEKWIFRLQKELYFLKEITHRTKPPLTVKERAPSQMEMFG